MNTEEFIDSLNEKQLEFLVDYGILVRDDSEPAEPEEERILTWWNSSPYTEA